MTELKPCPFCGSGWLYETQRNGYCDETPMMFCNSCKAVVTWEQVEEEGVNDETRLFVREHWNTRAYTNDEITLSGMYLGGLPIEDIRVFGMTLDEVRQMMKRDAERERTCHDANTRFNAWTCSECKCTLLLMFDDYGDPTLNVDEVASVPNYCPNCGARVIGASE